VAAVALGLQDALQDLRLWRLIIHAIKVLGDLLHLPTQLFRQPAEADVPGELSAEVTPQQGIRGFGIPKGIGIQGH